MESRSGSDAPSHPGYYVYVLRLWRESDGATWRIVLQDARRNVRQAFPSLDALMAHLLHVMSDQISRYEE
jgi:hypothetical protein